MEEVMLYIGPIIRGIYGDVEPGNEYLVTYEEHVDLPSILGEPNPFSGNRVCAVAHADNGMHVALVYQNLEEFKSRWVAVNQPPKDAEVLGVYISGPMTGRANYNKEAFDEAKRMLVQRVNPTLRIYNPCERLWVMKDEPYLDIIRRSVHELTWTNPDGTPKYSHLLVLDGYEYSFGCTAEIMAALTSGIQVHYIGSFERAGYKFKDKNRWSHFPGVEKFMREHKKVVLGR